MERFHGWMEAVASASFLWGPALAGVASAALMRALQTVLTPAGQGWPACWRTGQAPGS